MSSQASFVTGLAAWETVLATTKGTMSPAGLPPAPATSSCHVDSDASSLALRVFPICAF